MSRAYVSRNPSFCVYDPAPGDDRETRSYRVVDGGILESLHEGRGLTVEMIADGIRELFADDLDDRASHDIAVFQGTKLVAIFHRRGRTITVVPVKEPLAKPSRRKPS